MPLLIILIENSLDLSIIAVITDSISFFIQKQDNKEKINTWYTASNWASICYYIQFLSLVAQIELWKSLFKLIFLQ